MKNKSNYGILHGENHYQFEMQERSYAKSTVKGSHKSIEQKFTIVSHPYSHLIFAVCFIDGFRPVLYMKFLVYIMDVLSNGTGR